MGVVLISAFAEMTTVNMIKNSLEKILHKAGASDEINLSIPPKPEMGDFAFACFDLAKATGVSPVEAAAKFAKEISGKGIIAEAKAFGPYVNMYLRPEAVIRSTIELVKKQGVKFGASKNGQNKKILVEYPSNNTHKELHIGHLRNICIGNSLVNILGLSGNKVIPVNYVNDFGAHVAKCLWGLQKFHAKEKPPADKQKWLGQIYAEASRYLKDNPDAKTEVQELQKQLEAQDKKMWPLYLKTRDWSLKQFAVVFKELGVPHKKTFYEKDIKHLGQKVVDELLKKKIATVGEGGAIIVDLSALGLDIALLRKSDGTGLYLTADLGLALVKNKSFPHIAESIHITGTEQNLYFKQLFKVLELAGYKFQMTHIGYGLVNLPTGKMSSREGNVVLYDEVFANVYEHVLKATSERHNDWTKKKIESTARLIALAAIKFDFLKHESAKVMIFDPESAASFDGFTGPYVLYTVARINSLLKKAGAKKNKVDYALLSVSEEKQLAIMMSGLADVVAKARVNYNPSAITKYAFDLAKAYNDFYHKHSVLSADGSGLIQARLALSLAVKTVLENALRLLSIEPVKEM